MWMSYPHSCWDLIGAPGFSSIQSEALWENLQTHRYKTWVLSLRHYTWYKALLFIKNMYYKIINDNPNLFVCWFLSGRQPSGRIKYYKLILKQVHEPYLWEYRRGMYCKPVYTQKYKYKFKIYVFRLHIKFIIN